MPNRILKESVWRSPNLSKCDRLSCELFFRLLPLADDFGCFEADPLFIHGRLYPRCYQLINDADICCHLLTLAANEIIGLWTEDSTLWGFFINWEKHQRIRNIHQRKTPPVDNKLINNQEVINYLKLIDINCCQLPSIDCLNPNPNPNPNPKKDNHLKKKKLTYEEWKIYCKNTMEKLLADKKWINEMEKDYPTVNIQRTTEKVFEDYFITEGGYKDKKGNPNCNWNGSMNYQLGPLGGSRVFKSKNNIDKPDYSKMV